MNNHHMKVDPVSGAFLCQVTDIEIPCRDSTLVISRAYNSLNENCNNFPWGEWRFNFDELLSFDPDDAVKAVYPNSFEDRFEVIAR